MLGTENIDKALKIITETQKSLLKQNHSNYN